MPSSISRPSRRRGSGPRARRSGSTRCRPTTSSRRRSPTASRRVVWASCETVLGLPFDIPPAFAPIDETIEPRPESSYSLSKLVGETMAAQFARRSGIGFVGLRISNIMEPDDYAAFPSCWDDPSIREVEPVGLRRRPRRGEAASLALEAPIEGAQVAIMAAADTVMIRPSADLMAEVFPGVPLRRPVEGRETLLAIDHARRLLGYEPRHRWADHVAGAGGTTWTPEASSTNRGAAIDHRRDGRPRTEIAPCCGRLRGARSVSSGDADSRTPTARHRHLGRPRPARRRARRTARRRAVRPPAGDHPGRARPGRDARLPTADPEHPGRRRRVLRRRTASPARARPSSSSRPIRCCAASASWSSTRSGTAGRRSTR